MKKTATKNKKPSIHHKTSHRLILAVIGIIALTIIIIVMILLSANSAPDEDTRDYKTREEFGQIEQTVEIVRQQAETAGIFGLETFKGCNQFSQKYGEGAKYCTVGIETMVAVDNDEQAQAAIDIFENVLNQRGDRLFASNSSLVFSDKNVNFPKDLKSGIATRGFKESVTGTDCAVTYDISEHRNDKLKMVFKCRGYVTDLYYENDQ